MDPEVALATIRRLIGEIHAADNLRDQAVLGENLADVVEGLDEWLCKGGYLPDAWKVQAFSGPGI